MSYGRRNLFTGEAEITVERAVREGVAAYLVPLDNRKDSYYRNKQQGRKTVKKCGLSHWTAYCKKTARCYNDGI